jgi:hypothetical protein
MSWTIAGKYVRASATDPDAQAYLQAVEAVDGQALEFEVARAIDNFVLGCKADGIWNAIKASCILAGARTRLGALTPLVGTAPTSFNFVDGDYNRKTGLVGNGSTKYLDSSRNNNADPQNSQHVSVFATTALAGGWIGGGTAESGTTALLPLTTFRARSRSATLHTSSIDLGTGLSGINRPLSTQFILRGAGANETVSITSQSPLNVSIRVFARGGLVTPPAEDYTASRLAFYSIGESLDLALLDARVTDLINAFDTAIPS